MRTLLAAVLAAGLTTFSFAQAPAGPASPTPSDEEEKAAILGSLGSLSNSLEMAISMDRSPNGSVVFAGPSAPRGAMFTGTQQFVSDEGRQCVSFSRQDSYLAFTGAFQTGNRFTVAAWVKLPGSVIWGGTPGQPLFMLGGQIMCGLNKPAAAFCANDRSLTGWHHFAVTSNGQTAKFYIDGALKGTAPAGADLSMARIARGTSLSFSVEGSGQSDLLDDMFIFSRSLTVAELTKLATVRLPMHAPLPHDSGLSRFPSPQPAGPVAGSIPPPSVDPEKERSASELVQTYRNSLVFVSGEGAGSGFIANFNGKPFLLTNAHVAAGVRGAQFKTVAGNALAIGAASVAVGHDIFTMQAPATNSPFEVMTGVEENTSIGDDVVVLGNAEGGGVINTIMGKIVGVGPSLVEVDAPFKPGNSGSPIIHLKSKKVIGVATYLTIRKFDTTTNQPVKDPVIRRFGYRIDSVKTWQPVQWQAFHAQAAEMEAIENLTKDLITFIKDVADDSRVNRNLHLNPVIGNRIDAWLGSKNRRMSAIDISRADQNFIAFLKITSQSDITAAQSHLTYDYFQRELAEQQKERTAISGVFEKIIKTIQSDR